MRKLKFVILGIGMFAFIACSEGSQQETELIEHNCSDSCVDGNHVYAHGEKGHVCTPECKRIRGNKG